MKIMDRIRDLAKIRDRAYDLIYHARQELSDAVVERYARPLRERVAELESDNHQLHIALASDVTKINDVINAARDVSGCKKDGDEGPCGGCLEMLDDALGRLDGEDETKTARRPHG